MLKKLFRLYTVSPIGMIRILLDKIYTLEVLVNKNIETGGKLTIIGKPLIDIRKGNKLIIGYKVTLNSRNRGYHINMHSPVKLFMDGKEGTIKIGDKTRIHGTCIHAKNSITIGKNCLIAANCQIFDSNGHDLSFHDVENRINTKGVNKPIIIEDNVWIGANTIILPGITIGNGSVITANSVVVKDIPPMTIAGGNPAVSLKQYKSN